MSTIKQDVGAAILVFLGAMTAIIAIAVGGTIMQGLVFMRLWGWFITPLFGLRELTIWEAIGVGLTMTFLTHKVDTKKHESQAWYLVLGGLAAWLGFALLTGWIVHVLMTG